MRTRTVNIDLIWSLATGKDTKKQYKYANVIQVLNVVLPQQDVGWSTIHSIATTKLRPALRRQFRGIGRLSLETARERFGERVSISRDS